MIETPSVNDPSLVYMYGLSDFWTDMFADKQLVQGILGGETTQLAEVYSYFLQRSAGISLEDIQHTYQTRIKLLLLRASDAVDSSDLSAFYIDESVVGIEKLANRPILPTLTLDADIDFEVRDGVITFNTPITELSFPVRHTTDGIAEYAIWMCDVEINDKWIDNSFGRLVGFTEDDAIFNYKSFLEGVYYLYANGPNLSFIERGVNLAMGMPYARATETVLDITQDAVSGNWVVFTPTQGYSIPYGYRPDLSVGDTLIENEVLSTWVEVVDYSTSGAWWYQIYLPQDVLGTGVSSVDIGMATKGSTGDYMMETFLKNHLFEVLITQPSSDITAFDTARELVLRSKPEYTYPIFIWKVPIDEEFSLDDDSGFLYSNHFINQEYCVSAPSVRYMDRGTEDDQFTRGKNWYNRCQGSTYAATLIGYGDWPDNAGWAPQFQDISEEYLTYLGVLMRGRGDTVAPTNRGVITRGWRSSSYDNTDGVTWEFKADEVYGSSRVYTEVAERNITPLYLMNRVELINKMSTLEARFSIGDRTRFLITDLNLPDSYETWMIRNSDLSRDDTGGIPFNFEYTTGDLNTKFSPFAYQSYVPTKSDLYDEDGYPITDGTIAIMRCTDDTWAVQWVRNRVVKAPTLFPVEDQDWVKAYEVYNTDHDNDYSSIMYLSGYDQVDVKGMPDDVLVTEGGLYLSTDKYSIEVENSYYEDYTAEGYRVEIPNTPSRTYVNLVDTSTEAGYITNLVDTGYEVTEESLDISSGPSYTLVNPIESREEILVISDGLFEFDYTVSSGTLTLTGDTPTESLYVRYVALRDEEVIPAGTTDVTLSEDSECKIFSNGALIEEWSYARQGTSITLSTPSSAELVIRYSDYQYAAAVGLFTRSTVEDNQARFLMDRSRPDGVYDDYYEQVTYMNRSGVSGSDHVNVFRRLR